jgi:hypothetical protein
MSQQISQSKLLRLEDGVETKSKLFEIVKIFSTVEMHSLTMSRSRLSIKTRSRQIKTPRLTLNMSDKKTFFIRSKNKAWRSQLSRSMQIELSRSVGMSFF